MSGRVKQSSASQPRADQPRSWLDTATGLWSNARQLASPHCDARPTDEVSLLVIHNISLPPGEFGAGYIDALFQGQLDATAHPYFAGIAQLKVSAHACIFRDGLVTQYVPTTQRAWHAGESSFEGRNRCNDFSIGIELEGTDEEPFTDAQYAALTALTGAILKVYLKITPKRIVGHSNIAPGRKTDPGPYFDWLRYRRSLGDRA